MLAERLTLMIHTCDKFSDLWDAHAYLLNKNWPDRNIDTLLVTDLETERTYDGIRTIAAGSGKEISERTAVALDAIKTEYVLVTLDDYFLIRPVSSDRIGALLDIMDKENLDYIRLFCDPNSFRRIPGYQDLYRIALDQNYDVNLYQGIWRKSFIEKTIGEPMNAWQYEVSLTRIARRIGAKCALCKGKPFEILDGVRKGKLLNKAHRYLRKHNLYSGSREVLARKEEMRIFVFNQGKKILPRFMAIWVKDLLRKSGYKFYSESI